MKKKELQQKQVKEFFDSISDEYAQRYQTHPFLQYFFQQRLQEAISGFSFEEKNILDVGAGTGSLFNFFSKNVKAFEYFATDISPQMLHHSNIPPDKIFIGDISAFPFPEKKYDFIFLLGITTYFNSEDLDHHLNFIEQHLSPQGTAIISFTNRKSIDFRMRKIARFFTKLFRLKKKVIGQSFQVFAYTPAEIQQKIQSNFSIQKEIFLNQTIPPFNRIFPKLSISFAQSLKKRISSPSFLSLLSSDFLVFIKKN